MLPEPGERSAHRRLAHRHPGAGVGEIALLEQRVQREQQVCVDVPKTPIGHGATIVAVGPRSVETCCVALGGTDLNLLLPLKALLEEGNVTRAGQRLGLSQPAMSAALARLRRRFNDELLTRDGREYELTSFAVDLLPEVQHAVRLMEGALRVVDGFDPARSERTFRLVMSDYAIAVVHEPLVSRVNELAPGVRLSIDPMTPQTRTSDHVLLDYDALVAPLGFGFAGRVPAALAGPDGLPRRPAELPAAGRRL